MSNLDTKRIKIDQIDQELMKLLDERFNLTQEIGKFKFENNLPIENLERENDILSKSYDYKNQLPIEKVYQKIISISKDLQNYRSFLLGGDTSYSLSPMIHQKFGNDYYECLEKQDLATFLKQNIHFKAINITNPYKSQAYEYCLNNQIELDDKAKLTKTVNLIINNQGVLKGYNTDFDGFNLILQHFRINLTNKNVLILGNGATSNTVEEVIKKSSPKTITKACRTIKSSNDILFSQIDYSNTDVIINTTSYGVSPDLKINPLVNLNQFNNLQAIIDVNYNPLRSSLLIQNNACLKVNGLLMLVEQARITEELVQNKKINQLETIKIYQNLYQKVQSFVLIGMPFSGKTTIGQKLSVKLNKSFFDSDIILKEENLNLSKLLSLGYSVQDYREYESDLIKTLANIEGSVISTGGGIIENYDNIYFLKQKGLIIFINTPLEVLKTRILNDRPLVKNENDLEKLYFERINKYLEVADIIVNGNQEPERIIQEIEEKIHEYFNHQWS